MHRRPTPTPALAAALAIGAGLAAGCGSGDRAAREELARVQAACATLVGATVADANLAIQAPPFVRATCTAGLSPFDASDTCPGAPGPYTAPVCTLGYEFCAPGTSVCAGGPGGCAFACVVRVAGASTAEVLPASTICAARFVSGQPITPVSGIPCQ